MSRSEGGEGRGEGGRGEITAGQSEAEMTSDTPNNISEGKQRKTKQKPIESL